MALGLEIVLNKRYKIKNFIDNFRSSLELVVKNLPFLLAFSLFGLFACSSGEINNYPRLTDQIAKEMEKSAGIKGSLKADEVPNLSNQQKLMSPGHLFAIYHPSDSKLSGRYRADFNGRLRLPYNVVVEVKNKSFNELRDEVLENYSKFFQRGVSKVSFELSRRDYYVEVRGLVKKPGRYLVSQSDTLDLVINQAGGVEGNVVEDYFSATLKQQQYSYQVLLNSYFENAQSSTPIYWVGGDSVFVAKLDSLSGKSGEMPFVTILGGVNKPGKILYQKDASLYYYIDKASGAIAGLGYKECYVFRNTVEGVKRINFDFDKPETIPVIFPNDTIYMNTQVQTAGDTWLSRITQIASVISMIALLIIAL